MVVDLDCQPAHALLVGHALRHGPGRRNTMALEAKVPVQVGRVVFLDDEFRHSRLGCPGVVPVSLVTDTTHYLPRPMVAGKHLSEVSLYVKFEGRQVHESELLEDFDGFYDSLRTAQEMPTTSQPSI